MQNLWWSAARPVELHKVELRVRRKNGVQASKGSGSFPVAVSVFLFVSGDSLKTTLKEY